MLKIDNTENDFRSHSMRSYQVMNFLYFGETMIIYHRMIENQDIDLWNNCEDHQEIRSNLVLSWNIELSVY